MSHSITRPLSKSIAPLVLISLVACQEPDSFELEFGDSDFESEMDAALDASDDAFPDSLQFPPDEEDAEANALGIALEDRPLAPGWSCLAFTYAGDIWIRTMEHGQPRFEARIGAGGAISELRDYVAGNEHLLSPSFNHEQTDRVVQWTMWSPSVTQYQPQLPEFEWRFNVTQAGTFDNTLAPTHFVDFDAQGCRVDVYSSPRDQWKTEQQPHMQGTFATRTRYDVIGPGQIVVRRTTRVGRVRRNGQIDSLDSVYLEAWSPFRRPNFNAMALALDGQGNPTWWYSEHNFPHYPSFPADQTYGYATAFKAGQLNRTLVSVAYGTQDPCHYSGGNCWTTGDLVLNSMQWDTGIGILPGLWLDDLQPGQLVDRYIVVAPSRSSGPNYAASLAHVVSQIPPARVFDAQGPLPSGLGWVRSQLNSIVSANGHRTDHIASLIR